MLLRLRLRLRLMFARLELRGRWTVKGVEMIARNDRLQSTLFDVLLQFMISLAPIFRIECDVNAAVAVELFRVWFDNCSERGGFRDGRNSRHELNMLLFFDIAGVVFLIQ